MLSSALCGTLEIHSSTNGDKGHYVGDDNYGDGDNNNHDDDYTVNEAMYRRNNTGHLTALRSAILITQT